MTQRTRRLAAVSLGAFGMVVLGCSGEANSGDPAAPGFPSATPPTDLMGEPGTDPSSAGQLPNGNGPLGPDVSAGGAGAGQAGPATTAPQGEGPSTGPSAVGEDPNAIPAEPPPIELVPTSRLARLSRLQWSGR